MEKSNNVSFRPREEGLHKKWGKTNPSVTVNNQQYSFDTPERYRQFIDSLCVTEEEKKKYKKYREEWYRRAKEFDPGDVPLSVTIELTSACNLNCPMCYTRTEEFQAAVIGGQRVLPWNIVKAIVDECAEIGVYSLLFSWRGESSLYTSEDRNGNTITFPDVLAYARKMGILEITSLTNGQILDEDIIRKIIEADPSWISFSLDGLEKNYNKIRTPVGKKGTDYNAFLRVVANIIKMKEIRIEMGRQRPQIRTNTIYPPIAEDPSAYHAFMKKIGVGWVTVNEILDFRGEELPDDAIIENWTCQYPFQRLTVSANGSILPCTGAHNEERELLLGRYPGSQKKEVSRASKTEIIELPERSLKEAWHCQKIEHIRELHKQNRRREIWACKHCRHGAVKHGVEWIPEDWNLEDMEWKGHRWRE